MKKDLIISISRKYLGLMLVVASLLLIASTNSSSTVTSTSRNGSVVTFLSPKRVPTNSQAVATGNLTNNDVNVTTSSNTPVIGTATSVNDTTNSGGSVPESVPTPAQNDTSVPPTEVYVPPANDDPELYTPPYPYYPCGSCRPITYDKKSPQVMCPQYMGCMY
ncbi:MAG: hypothetical protein ABIO22_01300 [Candidatus Saccharimonadales bacterium]